MLYLSLKTIELTAWYDPAKRMLDVHYYLRVPGEYYVHFWTLADSFVDQQLSWVEKHHSIPREWITSLLFDSVMNNQLGRMKAEKWEWAPLSREVTDAVRDYYFKMRKEAEESLDLTIKPLQRVDKRSTASLQPTFTMQPKDDTIGLNG